MIKSKERKRENTHGKAALWRMLILLSVLAISFITGGGGNAFAGVKLKGKVPDLCYKCHKELKKELSDKYVHALFKKGECLKCHNSHVSNVKGLMNDGVDSICMNCHRDIRDLLRKGAMHSALRESICTDCHYAHSGENKSLLVTKEKNLCLNCHEDIRDQMKKSYACRPFKEGKCSACHDSHGSVEDNLLRSSPNSLCRTCHTAPACSAGGVSIASEIKDMDCTTCHSGHSSKDRGILGPYGHTAFLIKKCTECHNPIKPGRKITTRAEGDALCYKCHKKDDPKTLYMENDVHVKNVKNSCNTCHDYHASGKRNLTKNEQRICISCHEKTEKRTASMEKALKTVKCAPVKNRRCFECHIPVHSERKLYYISDEITMCAKCHEAQHKITHPIGEDVKDPRNGQPLTCLSCHSMHSAREKYMLTFDRARALCIQCHKL